VVFRTLARHRRISGVGDAVVYIHVASAVTARHLDKLAVIWQTEMPLVREGNGYYMTNQSLETAACQ
jgi:hypothetical protein